MSRRTSRRCLTLAAFALVFLWAAWFTGCDLGAMWSRRDHLTDIVSQMVPPDWSFAGKALPLLWSTVQMSVTGTFLGAALAIPAAMVCAAPLPGPAVLKKAVRFCIQVLRSFPALILALLATFFLGIGSFAGTAAITVYTFAIMARLTYEDIESAPQGPYLALRTMGASPVRAFARGIFPEILPAYLTNGLYLLEGNVRHSSILGYVGAGGIGLLLNEKVSWREYDRVGMILLLLFVIVYGMEHLSAFLTALVQITLNNLLRLHGAASVYGSDIALSVYGMMMKVYQIAHAMFVGVSSAVQPINGYNFGARHFARVRQTYRMAAAIALVISAVWFLVFQLFPRQIGRLFVSDSGLYLDCAQHCFRLYMAAFFLYGLHLATASFFQGIGRPVPSLAIPLARQGVFLIPLAIVLSSRFGLDGALLAAPIADALTFCLSLLLVWREFTAWRRKGWIER